MDELLRIALCYSVQNKTEQSDKSSIQMDNQMAFTLSKHATLTQLE